MTPDFNYALERSVGGASRLQAAETRPRVRKPNGKAQLTSYVTLCPAAKKLAVD